VQLYQALQEASRDKEQAMVAHAQEISSMHVQLKALQVNH
jgi:hypothetical protein